MALENKEDRETYIIERDKYIRVDLEYPEFNSSKGPFDKTKKVKSIVDKVISKASDFYPIIKRDSGCKRNYNKYTGELSIKIKMDYWKSVPRTHCVVNEDYLLMEILEWVTSFINRKLSKCNLGIVYYQYIINIDRL